MTQVTATIDGIRGLVKIQINHDGDRQLVELKWHVFDSESDGIVGFMASFTDSPILVTETAAEQFIRMILSGIVNSLNLKPEQLKILNYLGEELQDVEFIPPTYTGNEADILYLVGKQDTLRKIYHTYEVSGDLSEDCILACQQQDILEDFLSLVQVKASGLVLALRKPDTKE